MFVRGASEVTAWGGGGKGGHVCEGHRLGRRPRVWSKAGSGRPPEGGLSHVLAGGGLLGSGPWSMRVAAARECPARGLLAGESCGLLPPGRRQGLHDRAGLDRCGDRSWPFPPGADGLGRPLTASDGASFRVTRRAAPPRPRPAPGLRAARGPDEPRDASQSLDGRTQARSDAQAQR